MATYTRDELLKAAIQASTSKKPIDIVSEHSRDYGRAMNIPTDDLVSFASRNKENIDPSIFKFTAQGEIFEVNVKPCFRSRCGEYIIVVYICVRSLDPRSNLLATDGLGNEFTYLEPLLHTKVVNYLSEWKSPDKFED